MPKFALSATNCHRVVERWEKPDGSVDEVRLVADFSGGLEPYPPDVTAVEARLDWESRKQQAAEYARFLNLKESLPTLDALCSDLNADIVKLRMTAQLKYSTTIATNAHRIWVALRTLLNVPVAVPAPLDFDEKKWKERDGRGH